MSKLVDDQELVSGELPLQAKQSLLVASLQQFMDAREQQGYRRRH
jgi:hypothetical protein